MQTIHSDHQLPAGWKIRAWDRSEMGLIRSWYHRMRENGFGDWGDGPDENQIAHTGVMAEFEGKPVACVFLFISSSKSFAAIMSAVCDTDISSYMCFKGLTHAAAGGRDYCLKEGVQEIVSFVRTPTVIKAFKVSGFEQDGHDIHHAYLADDVLLWLEP